MVIRPAGKQSYRRCKKGNLRTVALLPGKEQATEKCAARRQRQEETEARNFYQGHDDHSATTSEREIPGEQAMTARRDFVCNLYTSRERLYDALALKKKKGECVAVPTHPLI